MTVYRHRDKWRAQYNGKSLGVFKTKREAKDAEAAHIASAKDPAAAERTNGLTVSQWRDQWLEQMRPGRKLSTIDNYRANTARFERDNGDTPIAEFGRRDAAQWAARWPSTVGTVGQMFRHAVKVGLIDTDPFAGVERPQYRRRLEPGWLTADDVAGLERAAREVGEGEWGVMLATMVTVAAWTAIRPGELFAVRPRAVKGPRLDVFRAVERGRVDGVPKNSAGHRTVVFPKAAQDAFTAAREASEFLWPGRLDEQDAPVWCNRRGDIWRTASFQWHWEKVRNRFGRPQLDFYELRHFGVTRLIEAGVSYEDIAVQVGHSNTKQIERVYGHPNAEHARKRVEAAMEAMARVQSSDAACAPSVHNPAAAAGGRGHEAG